MKFARFTKKFTPIHVYTVIYFTFCYLIFLKMKLWCIIWLNSKIRNGYQIRVLNETIQSFQITSSMILCLVKLVTETKSLSGSEFFKVCYMKIGWKGRVNCKWHLVCKHLQLLKHHQVAKLEQLFKTFSNKILNQKKSD